MEKKLKHRVIYVSKGVAWHKVRPLKRDVIYLTGDKEREAMYNYAAIKGFEIEYPDAFFDALYNTKHHAQAVLATAPNGMMFYYPYFVD